MRNPLEEFCSEQLQKAGLQFEYEKSFELIPAFTPTSISIERKGKSKVLKIGAKKYKNIIISPDFVGDGWIVETKGIRRPSFDLRWKLFKYIHREKDWILLLPSNQKDILVCIDIIKQWQNGRRAWSNEELLLFYENIQLPVKSNPKPKAVKNKKGSSGTVRKRRFNSF